MSRKQESRRSGGHLILFAVLSAGVVAGSTAAGVPAAQPSALVFHDLAAITPYPFAGMRARGAMGQTASMFLADVPAGARTTPHHHHQEQFMFGLEGGMQFVLAGSSPQPLARLSGSFAPANVQHGIVNGSGAARYIEFQPVLRPDWYPPHPRRPREGTPQPLPLPRERKVTEDFGATSGGWRSENGVRVKSLDGDTASITVWHLPGSAGVVDLAVGVSAERFVYVVEGDLAVTDGGTVRNVSRDALIVIAPDAGSIRASAPRRGSAVLAVFAAFRR